MSFFFYSILDFILECRSRVVINHSLDGLFHAFSCLTVYGNETTTMHWLIECRFTTQSLDIIPYAKFDWPGVCKPSGEQQVPFYCVFICSKSAITGPLR